MFSFSEDDQLMAAIRASLAESSGSNKREPSGSDEEDDDEGDNVESWSDSESDSRASLPKKAPSVPEETATTTTSASQEEEDETSKDQTTTATTTTAEDNEWMQHLGADTDPVSSIVFRFPDGTKEQKSLPCTSTLQVNNEGRGLLTFFHIVSLFFFGSPSSRAM